MPILSAMTTPFTMRMRFRQALISVRSFLNVTLCVASKLSQVKVKSVLYGVFLFVYFLHCNRVVILPPPKPDSYDPECSYLMVSNCGSFESVTMLIDN